MNTAQCMRSHSEYIQEIKKLLPKQAFQPAPVKSIYMIVYLLLLIPVYYAFQFTHNLIVYFILSIVITHCLSSVGFLAHELSHHSILKSKRPRHLLEVISWAVNLIPATLWDRVHNHTHHTQINTSHDPDRLYFKSEKTVATNLYTRIFYANKNIKWNPIVFAHFIPYIFRNIVAAFYPNGSKPKIVPWKPKYSFKHKMNIIAELVVIILFQIAIFNLVGRSWLAYLFASPLSYLLTSAIFNAYIFTNHFLNPVSDHSDPLLSTTTVKVPAVFNKIHFNFAYHTEHHLFPSMDSKYYPQLSKILKENYPDRYNYLTIADAWHKLWNSNGFLYDIPTSDD
jgi:fatty acid desaturase